VFKFVKVNGVKKLVQPGMGSLYARNNFPHLESVYPMLRSPYTAVKLACGSVAWCYSRLMQSVSLRIFAGYRYYGEKKDRFASIVRLFMNNIMNKKPPSAMGYKKREEDFVFIENIVAATIKTDEKAYRSIVNVDTGVLTSLNSLVNTINEVAGNEVEATYIPRMNAYMEKLRVDTALMKDVLVPSRPHSRMESGNSIIICVL
jgi:nucleoside-diphosphate-sugar epimerase